MFQWTYVGLIEPVLLVQVRKAEDSKSPNGVGSGRPLQWRTAVTWPGSNLFPFQKKRHLECRVSCCPLACPVGHRTAQSAEKFDKTQPNTHVPISGRVASGIDIPHPVTHIRCIARAPRPARAPVRTRQPPSREIRRWANLRDRDPRNLGLTHSHTPLTYPRVD